MSIELILQLHRATHRVGLFLAASEPALGVSQAEAHILAFLSQAGRSPIGAVHRAFAHKRSTLTGVLDRLESKGWLTREPHPEDRRSILLRLTPKGARQATRVKEAMAALGQALAEELSPHALAATVRCLESLEQAAERAGGGD